MVKNRPLMGGALIEEYENMKTSAEPKEPDISWHFAIVSFGSISVEGCVLRAALLHFILCAENWLSGSRSIPDWIPWNLHEARAGSRKHFRFQSVNCIVFSEIKGFLDACSLSQSLQQGFKLQILMLSLPLPIHLLDRLLHFEVTFSLGLRNQNLKDRFPHPPKKGWNIEIWKCKLEEINGSFHTQLVGSCGTLATLDRFWRPILQLRGERATIKPGPGHYKLPNLADRLVTSLRWDSFWLVVDADHFVKRIFLWFFQRFWHLKIGLELGRWRIALCHRWQPYRHRMARNAYPDKEQPARWKFGQEPRGLLPT